MPTSREGRCRGQTISRQVSNRIFQRLFRFTWRRPKKLTQNILQSSFISSDQPAHSLNSSVCEPRLLFVNGVRRSCSLITTHKPRNQPSCHQVSELELGLDLGLDLRWTYISAFEHPGGIAILVHFVPVPQADQSSTGYVLPKAWIWSATAWDAR